MLRGDNKGFGLIQGLLGVVLIGVICAAGFYVYKIKDNKSDNNSSKKITSFDECVAAGNPIMESYPEQCAADGQTFVNKKNLPVLELNETKVPTGWNVSLETDDGISLDNSAIDMEITESCTVEANHVKSENIKKSDEAALKDKLRKEYSEHIFSDKGYVTEEQPNTVMRIQLDSEQAVIPSFLDLVTLPNSEFGLYERKAYIVVDGAYVALKQSCRGADFTESDEALLAITVRI